MPTPKRMAERTHFQARLTGTGGQGLALGGRLLADALVADGMQVAQSQSYEPTSRGGMSRSDLVVSVGPVDYPLVTGLDYLLILDQSAIEGSARLLHDDGLVLVDSDLVPDPPHGDFTTYALPLTSSARRLGNLLVANVVSLGALVALSGICSFAKLEIVVQRSAPAKYRDLNLSALRSGQDLAR
jgi:2-oxoglutarate ferredoxin oxidoreductase subunit gamma